MFCPTYQLRYYSCLLSIAVNTWQTICVHNPEEAEFYSQLIQIIRLTCALFSRQRHEGISTWRSKWQTESPWYTTDFVSPRSSVRSSLTYGLNSVTPIRRLKSFEILFVLVPSSTSPGLQLGLEELSVLAEHDPFGNGVIGIMEMLLRAECKLHLAGLYLGLSTTFPMQPEWPWSGAQVESSSCLLMLRSRPELLGSVSLGLPVKGQHCFGHLLSLIHLGVQ
ncbi:uncharacterized protein DEA37_0015173, partial [Paragonimus westermani]